MKTLTKVKKIKATIKKKEYELSLDETVRKMWKKDPYMRALKRKMCPSRPVEEIFIKMLSKSRKMKTKEFIYENFKIRNLLDQVMSQEYFGSSQNRKRFYYLVDKITTQSRFERVPSTFLYKGYDLSVIDWLKRQNLNNKKQESLLHKANYYSLKYIVKPLIKHMYYPLKSLRGYKVTFIKKSKWQSFSQKNLNKLLATDYIIPSDLPHDSHCRGILRLYPKKDCNNLEYRPITCPHKKDKKTKLYFKTLSQRINKLALQYSSISAGSIYNHWKKYVEKIGDLQSFGIKMDIEDAFGNVNVQTVCELIATSTLFNDVEKDFIKNHLSNQYICHKQKLYKWTHGILQGDNLSASVCNLFISFLEQQCDLNIFKEYGLLIRHVDDYLFCTVNHINIEMFENIIKNCFVVNERKTEKSDLFNDNRTVELHYYGQIFNLETKEVSKLHKFEKGESFHHKFNFWSSKRPNNRINIITRILKFPYNNHYFKKLELNTSFNTETTVLKNYFEGMIFIAHKFDACVKTFANYKETGNEMDLINIVKNTVELYAAIVISIIRKLKGKYFTGNITFRLMRNIGYIAFELVLKRSCKFYSDVVGFINKMNLYLKYENLDMKIFHKLPEAFQNISFNRCTGHNHKRTFATAAKLTKFLDDITEYFYEALEFAAIDIFQGKLKHTQYEDNYEVEEIEEPEEVTVEYITISPHKKKKKKKKKEGKESWGFVTMMREAETELNSGLDALEKSLELIEFSRSNMNQTILMKVLRMAINLTKYAILTLKHP